MMKFTSILITYTYTYTLIFILYYPPNAQCSILLLADNNNYNKCDHFCDKDGGICIDNICTCKDSFSSLPRDHFKYCNYERKRRVISAFMELFIGFGAGHFYSERTVNGVIKLMVVLISCCCALCLIAAGSKVDLDLNDNNHSALKNMMIVVCLGSCVLFIWQITDFILFLLGVYCDGNGVNLI